MYSTAVWSSPNMVKRELRVSAFLATALAVFLTAAAAARAQKSVMVEVTIERQ